LIHEGALNNYIQQEKPKTATFLVDRRKKKKKDKQKSGRGKKKDHNIKPQENNARKVVIIKYFLIVAEKDKVKKVGCIREIPWSKREKKRRLKTTRFKQNKQ
jgi:hypothetical protein